MAIVEIKRQMRGSARAWKKLMHRRMSPVVAFRLFVRSSWKIFHALSLLTLIVIGGSIVLTLTLVTRMFFKLRGAK